MSFFSRVTWSVMASIVVLSSAVVLGVGGCRRRASRVGEVSCNYNRKPFSSNHHRMNEVKNFSYVTLGTKHNLPFIYKLYNKLRVNYELLMFLI